MAFKRSLGMLKSTRFYRVLAVLLVGISLVFYSPQPLWAFHPGFASCPPDTTPSGDPSSRVVVSILSAEPHTDLEGDDDFVPFYDNHADIFGRVTINGVEFELPKKEDDDFPHWEKDGRFV